MPNYATVRFERIKSMYATRMVHLETVPVVGNRDLPEDIKPNMACLIPSMIQFIGTRKLTKQDIKESCPCLSLPEFICRREIGELLDTQLITPNGFYNVEICWTGPHHTHYVISEGWDDVVHDFKFKAGQIVELWGFLDVMGEVHLAMCKAKDGATFDPEFEF